MNRWRGIDCWVWRETWVRMNRMRYWVTLLMVRVEAWRAGVSGTRRCEQWRAPSVMLRSKVIRPMHDRWRLQWCRSVRYDLLLTDGDKALLRIGLVLRGRKAMRVVRIRPAILMGWATGVALPVFVRVHTF